MNQNLDDIHWPKTELNKQEDFRVSLGVIENQEFTGEDISVFINDILNKFTNLTDRIVERFKKEEGFVDESASNTLEDMAFDRYGLPDMEVILDKIQAKVDQVEDIKKFITRAKHSGTVIVPPDEYLKLETEEGKERYKKPEVVDRLSTLIYILENDLGVKQENISIVKGLVGPEMMREEPYYRVDAKVNDECERIIYICNEVRNATYVFDKNKLRNTGIDMENDGRLDNMTKRERNDFISKNPGTGYRLVQRENWRDNISDLLTQEIGQLKVHDKNVINQDPNIPKVSLSELDRWRGFWTDENGEHWGSLKVISKTINTGRGILSLKILASKENEKKENSVRTRPLFAGSQDTLGYCIEDFFRLGIMNEIHLKKDDSGLRVFTDPESGEKYTSLNSYSSITGISHHTLEKKLGGVDNADKVKIKAYSGGREFDAYPVNFLVNVLGRDIMVGEMANRVDMETKTKEETDEWKEYLEKDGKHYGRMASILEKLALYGFENVSYSKLRIMIKGISDSEVGVNYSVSRMPIVASNGEMIKGYCFEDIKRILEEIPQCAAEGDYFGFATVGELHFGTISRIAKKLKRAQPVILDMLEKSGTKPTPHKIFLTNGKTVTGYCLEDVSSLMKK